MLRLELRLYMYLPPHIEASHYVTPQPGFLFVGPVSPGFRRRAAPPPGYHMTPLNRGSDFGGHSPAGYLHKLVVVGRILS